MAADTEDGSTISATVTGVSTGSHVFKWRIYNKNKSAYVETGTQTVTI